MDYTIRKSNNRNRDKKVSKADDFWENRSRRDEVRDQISRSREKGAQAVAAPAYGIAGGIATGMGMASAGRRMQRPLGGEPGRKAIESSTPPSRAQRVKSAARTAMHNPRLGTKLRRGSVSPIAAGLGAGAVASGVLGAQAVSSSRKAGKAAEVSKASFAERRAQNKEVLARMNPANHTEGGRRGALRDGGKDVAIGGALGGAGLAAFGGDASAQRGLNRFADRAESPVIQRNPGARGSAAFQGRRAADRAGRAARKMGNSKAFGPAMTTAGLAAMAAGGAKYMSGVSGLSDATGPRARTPYSVSKSVVSKARIARPVASLGSGATPPKPKTPQTAQQGLKPRKLRQPALGTGGQRQSFPRTSRGN